MGFPFFLCQIILTNIEHDNGYHDLVEKTLLIDDKIVTKASYGVFGAHWLASRFDLRQLSSKIQVLALGNSQRRNTISLLKVLQNNLYAENACFSDKVAICREQNVNTYTNEELDSAMSHDHKDHKIQRMIHRARSPIKYRLYISLGRCAHCTKQRQNLCG